MLKAFYEKNKALFEIKYNGKFDFNNDTILENFTVYSGGDALIEFKNGSTRKLSSNELYEFFIATVMNSEEIKTYFMTPNGQIPYKDIVSENHILELKKKYPEYLKTIRELGISTGIYTSDSESIFEQRIQRLEKIIN